MGAAHPRSVQQYLQRVGAEVLNFRRAIIKVFKGHYYLEKALIRIHPDGSVTCSVKEFAPTEDEFKAMQQELANIEFPVSIPVRDTETLKSKIKGTLFEFIDRKTGHVIMAQECRKHKDGTKSYIPWTFMSDGQWACMEPDGDLPFWKPRATQGPGAKIMIHEGAKAAKAVTDLLASDKPHPWRKELEEYEHWGMIGGALAPHRTDYDELRRQSPAEVVYVCDNDQPGVSALQKVSENWGRSMKGIRFGEAFPVSWDMADPMPPNLMTGKGRYIGSPLRKLMVPATFATELIGNPAGKGRKIAVLRPDFVSEWMHCVTPEVFIHRDWPNRVFSIGEFNSDMMPFSHVEDTARLLKREFSSKSAILKYSPGERPGIHGGSSGGHYINTFCDSDIKAEAGDPAPWLDFMEHLVCDESDRTEVLRWCATLIARPEVRMLYGVLLISETQGIGKGTLGEKVLAPLIGDRNVSYPSEQEIVESNYNYWLAHKRLAVVHEIYAGNSSKAYNKLKSSITDKFVTVQKKYQANYEIENWIHLLACSNSMRAMKLSMDDRRWLVPKLSEEKRPLGYWETFNKWLTNEGGLGIIKHWAKAFVEEFGAVEAGAPAPWSALKRQIVEESYSPGQMVVAKALEHIKHRIEDGELAKDVFVLDTDLVGLIRDQLYEGRHNDRLERPQTVRTIAKSQGWFVGEMRAQVKAWGPATFGSKVISLDEETARTAPADLGGDKAAIRRKPLELTSTF